MDYKYLYKFVVVGDSGVGKTSLCKYYINESPPNEDEETTIGIDYFSKINIYDGIKIKMNIWDTAGQEKFRSVCRSYYKYSTIAMICFSLSDYKSFKSLNHHINEVREYGGNDIHIVLVGTCADDINTRCVTPDEITEICGYYNINYYETSAINGTGIKELFDNVCIEILEKIDNNKQVNIKRKQEFTYNTPNVVKNNSCCILL